MAMSGSPGTGSVYVAPVAPIMFPFIFKCMPVWTINDVLTLPKRNSCLSVSNLLPCLQLIMPLMSPFSGTGTFILPVAQSREKNDSLSPRLVDSTPEISLQPSTSICLPLLLRTSPSPAWVIVCSLLTGLLVSRLAPL